MGARTAEREEFLADVIICAVEGGTGYWACVSDYKHGQPSETYAVLHEEDADGAIEGREGKYSTTPLRLDVEAVALGIGKIERGEVNINAGMAQSILAASRENEAGDIDADLADVIAQAALLGSIVYG